MGLRFDPIGGGQFKQAVKQIIEAESQPIRILEARKGNEDARLKLFQDFKSKFTNLEKALGEISDLRKLRELKVDLGDATNLVSVTLDKEKAEPGTYQMEILELAGRTSAISNGFENPDEPVLGIGFISMPQPNGETQDLFVDQKSSSLNGVARLINSRADLPVQAAVIHDDTPSGGGWKLILTGKKDGAHHQIDFPEFYFMDGNKDFYIDHQQDSKNALIRIDGFEIEKDGNDLSDFMPGVNLHLKEARPDAPFALKITEDIPKISGKVKQVIDQMNAVLSFINQQNTVNEKTNTTNTFAGDTILQTLEFRLRNLIHEGFPSVDPSVGDGPLVFLNKAGIEFDRTGVITFKEDKFNKMIEANYQGMTEAIAGQFGLASQLKELLTSYSKMGDGILTMKEKGIRDRIKNIDRDIEDKSRRLEHRQQQLTDQFSRLQGTLSGMQRQQQYLAASLGGGNGGGGGNLISQLMG